ncbi:TonB-dependent receptor plug domain-containing protein [Melioribacteraceae bacterium 4301-Me]|uniref:TonB-dependent receptor plug domain-containing protein n=1 Tax=Pyranulibacter aquaticus TaxID=3163344 RepID=UPI0035989478
MYRLIYILLILCFSVNLINAQEKEYTLNEIVVTAERIPVTFENLARTVTILSAEEIKSLPVDNVTDLLKYINGVDLKTRGFEGVQSDAGIRGGTFEQTLILIDGVKIIDPQTGHHNLNIPLSLNDIERIEVLKGQGSKVFGANAFGGVINIITKNYDTNTFAISTLGGEHNLYNIDLSSSFPLSFVNSNFSFEKKKSSGYTYNTDFEITNFSLNQNYSILSSKTKLFAGYIDKKFGANNFYSDLFPNQWEHTKTAIINLSSEINSKGFSITPKFYWRRNDDDFILDKLRPEYYRNRHKTFSYGGEVQASVKNELGVTTFGGELNEQKISSTNLGSHSRFNSGVFIEQYFDSIERLTFSVGLWGYNYSQIGWKFWPGFDVAYRISSNSKIYVSFGEAFRIPTFTELYYVSPANIGNPNLTYEKVTNYELGFTFNQNYYTTSLSIFYKDGNNIIDWARASKNSPWRVENISNVKTSGLELSLIIFPFQLFSSFPITKLNINYTYLSTNRSTGVYESKYLIDYLRHQLIVNIDNNLFWGLTQNWVLTFRDRINFNSQFIVDTQISKSFRNFNSSIRITNLFNKKYSDYSGVILPGRWITAGLSFSLKY